MTAAKPSTTDVAVLGAGAAGMFVALAAQARGLRVAVFDPFLAGPNNFALSGGLFPAAGSRLQRAAGVSETPQDWLDDLRAYAAGMVNEHIAESVALALPQAVDFLVDEVGAPIRFLPDMVAPGHRTLRFHSVVPASGASFHAWFRAALGSQPRIRVVPRAAAVQRAGAGFVLTVAGEPAERMETTQLVLAGGGFGANPAMVARYIPGMAGALHNGSATNDGSAIATGLGFGAQLWGMDGYQGQAHTNPGGVTRLGMSIPSLGGIMVNRQGRRFVREDLGPSALAPHVLGQPEGMALEVFDEGIESRLGNHSAYLQAREAGRVLGAASVRELAALAGVDAATLEATVAAVNRFAGGEQADPLGRPVFQRRLQPPFKASWVTGALSHTQGGLLTDAQGRVLDANEAPIPGLFAAGGCAAGLAGQGAEGYLPGNGLAQAFGLGWRVAQAIAA